MKTRAALACLLLTLCFGCATSKPPVERTVSPLGEWQQQKSPSAYQSGLK